MKLLYFIAKRIPAVMWLLVVLQLVLVFTPPFAGPELVFLWANIGFALQCAIMPRCPYTETRHIAYWVVREAVCWPHFFIQFCRGKCP